MPGKNPAEYLAAGFFVEAKELRDGNTNRNYRRDLGQYGLGFMAALV
jgi:hypothetical protein